MSEDRVMRFEDMSLVIKRFLENMNSEKNEKDKSDQEKRKGTMRMSVELPNGISFKR